MEICDDSGDLCDDENDNCYVDNIIDKNPCVQTGDEMSKRSKFVFCTWVGPNVSVMKKAKMSTDKALLKEIITVSKNIIYPLLTFLYLELLSRAAGGDC